MGAPPGMKKLIIIGHFQRRYAERRKVLVVANTVVVVLSAPRPF
jgi:hypothetical protein